MIRARSSSCRRRAKLGTSFCTTTSKARDCWRATPPRGPPAIPGRREARPLQPVRRRHESAASKPPMHGPHEAAQARSHAPGSTAARAPCPDAHASTPSQSPAPMHTLRRRHEAPCAAPRGATEPEHTTRHSVAHKTLPVAPTSPTRIHASPPTSRAGRRPSTKFGRGHRAQAAKPPSTDGGWAPP